LIDIEIEREFCLWGNLRQNVKLAI